MIHPGSNFQLFEHWTERDERVFAYLHKAFGVEPVKQPEGADLLCGDVRIEVKACREWIKKPRGPEGSVRRRGRFKFKGYEAADFILFVLERGDELLMTMLDSKTFYQRFGLYVRTLVWTEIFMPPPREHFSSRPMFLTGVTPGASSPATPVTPAECRAC